MTGALDGARVDTGDGAEDADRDEGDEDEQSCHVHILASRDYQRKWGYYYC